VKHGPSNTPDSFGERALIAAIRARLPDAPRWLTVGIGDDAAVARPERGALEILTTDALVESVHFDRRFSSPEDIGWKALAVNLSDIAAMGGTPRIALLSLGLPPDVDRAFVDALLDGFLALATESRVALAGGNITRSPGPLIVDVTVTGFARERHVLRRSAGHAGDELYVSGEIGAAAAALGALRTGGASDSLAIRHRRPQPRVRLGTLLGRNRAANACMDLSDGLADGVRQIAEASGTGAAIDAATLPIPGAAKEWFMRAGLDPITAAVAGGDDYELLFSVPRRARGRLKTVVRQARGVPVTRIGELTADTTIALRRDGIPEPLPAGFVHF
jgi:thiamine-monophosphate kinase